MRDFPSRSPAAAAAAILCLAFLATGCGGPKIVMHYPGETLDFSQGGLRTPTLFIDKVTDMRPPG